MNKFYQKIKEKIKGNYFLFIISINVKARILHLLIKAFGYFYTKRKFYQKMGYPLNLKNPQSLNEKLVWKKIYDRNPLLPVTADKYQVRSYIKGTLGEEQAKELLIPLLYVTDKPETIPFEKLPTAFIIKPNHASGRYIIIEDGKFNKEKIIDTCKKWLKIPYGLDRLEWAYRPIKRKILVEQLLRDDATIPKEFKFHIFHGKCKLIALVNNIMNNTTISFFDENWNILPVKKTTHPQGSKIERPKNFKKMLTLAERLSKPFDYVRMDLYSLKGKIFIGELTHYPASGMGKYEPGSFSHELGKHWKIKAEYWKKGKNLLLNTTV